MTRKLRNISEYEIERNGGKKEKPLEEGKIEFCIIAKFLFLEFCFVVYLSKFEF